MDELFKNWGGIIVHWLMTHGVKILLISISAVILNLILRKVVARAIRVAVVADSSTASSREAEKKREDTLIRILCGAIRIGIIVVSVLIILPEIGIKIGPLLAGAGIAGIALGFGSQYLIRDIISGLFIIIENQYRIGDVINIDDTGGLVEDISLRKTTLRDMNGTVHHVPHGEIKKVSNMSKKFARINLDLGISYNSDLEHVINVINQTGAGLAEDPYFKDLITLPPNFLRVEDFGNSSIVIKVVGETKPLKQWEVTGELRKRIKQAFDKEGIEIPFPQMVVHNPEVNSNS